MPGLKVFKRNFINMHRDITSVEGYSIMESLIPVKPKDVTSHRGKNLKFMTIHQRDAKRATRRNN
jgi:hypothetical protein